MSNLGGAACFLCLINLCFGAFTKCKMEDDQCLAKAIEDGIKQLQPGMPEFELPPLDPLKIDKLVLGRGTGAVHLVQNYRNIELLGMTQLTVPKAHFDAEKKILTFTTVHPNITQKAEYSADGQILVLQVYGHGRSTITFSNCRLDVQVRFKTVKKNDETFYKISDFRTHLIELDNLALNFENLFDGNKLLGDNLNKVINEEWRVLFEDVVDEVDKQYSAVELKYAQKLFDRLPVKYIFAD
ncbi:protein takeout-like [Cylas formicarius]|uniref:protein takeout-like n=1 Tax=Cylas formicarius TaxID=197179 RepID=UPI002958A41B|nr:protein takeout-like [Cylas formicarius]